MNRVVLFAICIVLVLNSWLLTGCNNNKAYILKNEEIDADTRAGIDKIADSICIALAKKNITYLYTVSGQYMKSQLPKLDSMLQAANVRCKARPVYDQFLVSNSDAIPGYDNLLHSQHNTYDYYFYPTPGLNYLYVTPVKTMNDDLDWLMVCTFTKDRGQWKLTSLYMGPYRYKRKTTFDYYRDYKAYFHKHEYMNAYLSLQLVNNLLRPGQYCTPAIEQGVLQARKSIDSVIKAGSFPLQTGKITSPRLTDFATVFYHGKVYPAVKYTTTVPITDTVAVKNEWRIVSQYLRTDATIIPFVNDSMVYIACDAREYGIKPTYRKYTYLAPAK
jgi:hypothetical protein